MPNTVTGNYQHTTMNTTRKLPTATAVEMIPLSSLTKKEQLQYINHTDHANPEMEFDRKVEALAELLGCSEADATKIILNSL